MAADLVGRKCPAGLENFYKLSIEAKIIIYLMVAIDNL